MKGYAEGKSVTDNIVLIGFMGVGKGRTARALATATDRFAIDTDDLIESFLKTRIRTFFAHQGEPAFRRVEQQVADWLELRVSGTVISTGGGFFMVNNRPPWPDRLSPFEPQGHPDHHRAASRG